MEWHKNAICSHECHPEMDLPKSFVHHVPGYLPEPEICSGEDPEERSHRHYQMKVSDHEVRCVEHDVNGRLREKETADPSTDEHGDEAKRKQRGGINPQ